MKNYRIWIRKGILAEGFLLLLVAVLWCFGGKEREEKPVTSEKQYIKWVDFKVSYEALCTAYELDVKSHGTKAEVDWIRLLAYAAAKTGGNVDKKACRQMEALAEDIAQGRTDMGKATGELEYYPYYYEAYSAVLDGLVGEYEILPPGSDGKASVSREYGLRAFSPIAKGFYYEDYDDFGASRSYGYARPHLGHDMLGQVGTPIVAVESGTVEAMGWNQYGGWRIGIRSKDRKRYYYYAHLRQNYPFAEGLQEGDEVEAGDVIGYMGHTGYSKTENVNNIEVVHLHWGMELIFDESQKESDNEIWIDVYALTRFLYKNRSEVEKVEGTREWKRVIQTRFVE